MKKWIALSLAAATLAAGPAVLAEENAPAAADDMIIEVPSNNPDIMLIDEALETMPIAEVPAVTGTVEGVLMKDGLFPVRQIAEGLGYTVNWDGEARRVEIIRGAQYITMDIDVDAYTFARRMPEALGSAPVIIEDRTYVPRRFVEEYLSAYVFELGEDLCDVTQASIVTIKGFEEDGSLLVEDEVRGEVIVHIAEETEIIAGGEKADVTALEEGMTISVVYGRAMTMSIPPQTTAVRIVIG
ncbi:MAG: copper amine oxidase N-terminal domain-containing protein [Clostridia bacterium]|nr:copper amine oxidase N-terminal domain-containing protein [Clostridia bacterium]